MKKRSVWSAVLLGVVGTGAGAYALAGSGQTGRPDCPGTVVCPLTGKIVCRDRCPLGADQSKTAESEPAAPAPCCAGSRTPKW